MKLLFVFGDGAYVLTHRLSLIKHLISLGHQIEILCPDGPIIRDLRHLHLTVHPLIHFHRGGFNPFQDIKAAWEIYKIIKDRKPDLVHGVAMKAMLTTLMATWSLPKKNKHKLVITLGGLGYLFLSNKKTIGAIRFILVKLVSYLFNHTPSYLILQNDDDLQALQTAGLKLNCSPFKIRGSGVCPKTFAYTPEPIVNEKGPIIVYVGRLLKDKGLYELIDALKILKENHIPFCCKLYGAPDPHNPASLLENQLISWQKEGLIEWMNATSTPYKAYAHSHIVVLPSYREGLPKALLEGALTGRPLVATDVPGCKDVVQNTVTGYLTPLKNSKALAKALKRLLENQALRYTMGKAAHDYVLKNFSDSVIHQQHVDLYEHLYSK